MRNFRPDVIAAYWLISNMGSGHIVAMQTIQLYIGASSLVLFETLSEITIISAFVIYNPIYKCTSYGNVFKVFPALC